MKTRLIFYSALLVFTGLFILNPSEAYAQPDSFGIDFYHDTTCASPMVKAKFELRFSDNSAKAYLRINEAPYQNNYYALDDFGSQQTILTQQIGDNEKLIELPSLNINSYYTVFTENSCGDTISLAYLSTHSNDTSNII